MYKKVNLKICFFKKVRKYIEVDMALTIYKSTILPLIEYADFAHDFGIKYVRKKIQGLQNYGLTVVYNQHIQPYMQRVSTEILHGFIGFIIAGNCICSVLPIICHKR